MIYKKSIQMTFYDVGDFAEPEAAQTYNPDCNILSYGREKITSENDTQVVYRLKIAMPYRRTRPYHMIREDSNLSFVHEGITFAVKEIQTILNGMGRPRMFIFDLMNTQKV